MYFHLLFISRMSQGGSSEDIPVRVVLPSFGQIDAWPRAGCARYSQTTLSWGRHVLEPDTIPFPQFQVLPLT